MLRGAGIAAPILVYPGTLLDAAAVGALVHHRLIATVHDRRSLEALVAHADDRLEVFLKIDSGLKRLGVPAGEASSAASQIRISGRLRLTGAYTHLHLPDTDSDTSDHVRAQFDTFRQAVAGLGSELRRMAASSRVLARFPSMLLDAVDPGRALYGLPWKGDPEFQAALKPAFAGFRTSLLQVKELQGELLSQPGPFNEAGIRRIGIVPIGLRDGLGRLNCGHVLVRGRRVRLVGHPGLEHCRVDLTDAPDAEPGDEVVVVGEQGRERITLADVLAANPELPVTAAGLEVGNSVTRVHPV
jgi:alanine racemase